MRELAIRPEALEIFKKYGADMAPLERTAAKIEATASSIENRHNGALRSMNAGSERFKASLSSFSATYEQQITAFEKDISALESRKSFDPERARQANHMKEQHLSARADIELEHATMYEYQYEEAMHVLGHLELETTDKALKLSVKTQEMIDSFMETAEERLSSVPPSSRESAMQEIRKDASSIIVAISGETESLLKDVKEKHAAACKEGEESLSGLLRHFKERYSNLIAVHGREDTMLIAALKMDKSFDALTHEEKMSLCDPAGVHERMRLLLESAVTTKVMQEEVQGSLTNESISAIERNARAEIRKFEKELASDTKKLLWGFAGGMAQLAKNSLAAGELGEVKAKDMDLLTRDCIQKLVLQDMESRKRQLGDHGIRHITGNIGLQNQVFDALEDGGITVSPRERLLAAVVQVNHDLGYLTEVAVAGYDKYHKQYGAEIFKAETGKLAGVFKEHELSFMANAILTHDDPTIDWQHDAVNSAIRLADNMSLFDEHKLPALFRYVDGSKELLFKMGAANTAGDKDAFQALRGELIALVRDSDIEYNLKRDLLCAAKEVHLKSAHFTAGMFAGHMGTVSFSKEKKCIDVEVLFDQGELALVEAGFSEYARKQYAKFASSLNVNLDDPNQTEFTMTGQKGESLVHVQLIRIPEAKAQTQSPSPATI